MLRRERERDGKGSERMTSSWLMFCNTIINLISCLYCDCHMITKLHLFFFTSPSLPLSFSLLDAFFPPGPLSISGFVAFPHTNTSILIQWLPPILSYVPSPLLLQYTLYYTRNSDSDVNTRPTITGLTTSAGGTGSYVLSGLTVGTEYYLTMRAINRAGDGEMLDSVLIVSTYGSGK